MKRKQLRTIATVAACAALLTASGQALAEQKRQHERRGRGGEMRGQFREEMKAHHDQQRQENQAFRETLKDKTPQEICTALKTHMSGQFTENNAFRDKMHAKIVEAVKARAAEHEGGGERANEMLAKMEKRHTEVKAKVAEEQAKALQKLTELSQKEDLTREELHEVMKAAREKHRERRQNRHQNRQNRRKKHQENRGGNKPPVEL